jgi:hypothetical protein
MQLDFFAEIGHAGCCSEGIAMAEIINFNKARKKKQRADAERLAQENRVRFGRNKLEKARAALEAEEAARKLDQLRREPPEET